jgi:hypothetical protein
VPLRVLFHPESRLVLAADLLAAIVDQQLHRWEAACLDCRLSERMGELRRKVNPLMLLTICGTAAPRRKTSFFALPGTVKNLFRPEELVPLTDQLRAFLGESRIAVSNDEVVCRVWAPADDDMEEAEED